MKILLVTEKHNPNQTQNDGGARLVETLKRSFAEKLSVIQFGYSLQPSCSEWCFEYPFVSENRFLRRIYNAPFIAQQVKLIAPKFTHIIFIHVSMQFESILEDNIETWTFPMFLTPSYKASGEKVPDEYTKMEIIALAKTKKIITPSYFEQRQLIEQYNVLKDKIHVIPRGIDKKLFKPVLRHIHKTESLCLCNVGSIKPQKNTLELVNLFLKILNRYPFASLRIIGPIQNKEYYEQVMDKINKLGITKNVQITGYIPHEKINNLLADCHIHLSISNCETFGRSIFETLATGIPNIIMEKNNAAYDFLQNLPYVKFISNNNQALRAVGDILSDFSKLSSLASEIGEIFDDNRLGKAIVATICGRKSLVVSDYDGTLYHKNNNNKTLESIRNFKKFAPRIICTARSTEDIILKAKIYDLSLDWIISYSGAIIANRYGDILFINPLSKEEIERIEKVVDEYFPIIVKDQIIQICTTQKIDIPISGVNIETYQGKSFLSNWKSRKLQAIIRLLDHINWHGTIKAIGDGKYDLEYLRYFDGCLIKTE